MSSQWKRVIAHVDMDAFFAGSVVHDHEAGFTLGVGDFGATGKTHGFVQELFAFGVIFIHVGAAENAS